MAEPKRAEQRERRGTRLDTHTDAPSVVQPGDAPHDTTDPGERAVAVAPDTAAAARAGHQTVNAVVPMKVPAQPQRDTRNDRIETYEGTRPDGTTVKVTRNIETGETETE